MARTVTVVGPAQALAESLGESLGLMLASMKDSADRRRRKQELMAFIDNLQEEVTRSQDQETAHYIIGLFEASDYSPEFNVVGEIQAFQRKRVYDFSINVVNEEFADALIARMLKFASIEYDATMKEVIERTLREVGFAGDESKEALRLLEAFPQYLSDKRNQKIQSVTLVQEHEVGNRTVFEYSDGHFEMKTISGSMETFSSLSQAKRYVT